ncbi:MAG: DUF58 domain-containing protein [Geminicoccaceae bacterium]
MRTPPRAEAERLASRLPPLLVAAERVASIVAQGVHGRRRVGIGESFWQFRHYRPGDPIRQIDWRQSAKGDDILFREQEWEAAQSVWLWCDRSLSMGFRSDRKLSEKGETAALLTLALSSLLVRAGERITFYGTGLRPQGGRLAIDAVMRALSEPQDELLPEQVLPRHARIVLISDWLMDTDLIAQRLRSLSAEGLRGHVVMISDPAELSLPYNGRVRFEGLEDEGDVVISNVAAARSDYRKLIDAHHDWLAGEVQRLNWVFCHHVSNEPPERALLALYAAMADLEKS